MIRAAHAPRAALVLALLAAAGCNRGNTPPTPSSFDLPEDVSFGCVRNDDGDVVTFVPLEECRAHNIDDATDDEDFSLIMFVTQVATGEVAAVDLRTNRSLDSSPLVPGFTYVQVGEIPSGIETIEPSEGWPTAGHPSVTYVSAFASRTIESLDTARLHPEATPTDFDPGTTDIEPFPESVVQLDEGPTDLVFVPVTGDPATLGYLFAPMPSSGTIAQVRVLADGTLDTTVTPFVLDPDPGAALGPSVADEVDPYQRICPLDRTFQDATAAVSPAGTATTAQPVKLEVDRTSNPPVLLVADEASPVIHRFEVGAAGATPLQGLAVGAPTLDVVTTPFVAASLADPIDARTVRYLYAVDATDGSILAVDYTPGSPTFGAVLAVNVGTSRPDRIAYREPARALEVIEPELLQDEPDMLGLCDPSDAERADDATPALLRGVFLAVGLQSGLVSVVDVWDLEATCRGGAMCQSPANSDDVEVAIRRHRPRIASFVTNRPVVTGSPSLSFETNPGLLDDDGRPSSGNGPGLAPVDCGPMSAEFTPFSVQGFPDPEDNTVDPALVCLRDDPWAGASQRVTATFEGPIPLTPGGDGLLVDLGGGALRFEAPNATFCAAGVLGTDDVAASGLGADDPELGYAGDQLEITGDLPPETRNLEECEVFDIPDDGTAADRDPIRFAIVAATDTTLELAPLQGTDPAAILTCFPAPTSYLVRTRDAYTVASTGLPMRHRVFSDGGACRVDTATYPVVPGDPDSYRNFRAIPTRTYIHPLFMFEITLAGEMQDMPLELGQESQLVFDVAGYPAKLGVDLGSVPIVASMRWNPIDDRLYVVDEGQFQVAQIDADAFGILRFFD